MVLTKENFIVEYNESLEYIPDVVSYLETKMTDLMDFFELKSLSSKEKVVVYDDLEKYKEHIEKYFEYHDYMCADTNDGNINILSLDAAHKTKSHSDMTVADLRSTILHEFVHICQQETEIEHLDDVLWFWEALATNLGNPEIYTCVTIKASNEEINDFNSCDHNYPIAFTIGKYMLDNYSHKDILDYVKYPSKLYADSSTILNKAREWSYTKSIK